ncbi:retrovirus-related pol polyprotein from transposon TNT 1-94, partial [Tanacetum coccineum]
AFKDQNWRDGMTKEIQALENNKTWIFTILPPGKTHIGSKWVYKIKLKADDAIDRYKAMLVAKGFNQKEGINYTETFALVAKMPTVRTLIAIALHNAIASVEDLETTNCSMTATPMDLSFAAQAMSQFSHNPRTPHLAALQRKQLVVSRSSTEAEYRSLADSTCEISRLKCLLHDLGIRIPTPPLCLAILAIRELGTVVSLCSCRWQKFLKVMSRQQKAQRHEKLNDTAFAEASVGTTFSKTLAVMMMGLSAIAVSAANNCPPAPAPTSDAKMPGLHEISIGIIHRE